MSEYHEPESELSEHARNIHRALTSLKEEIEAVDWYNQRYEASKDPTLRAVLAHNRDEEIEHASMTLEWLRRNMPHWDEVLRTYLFTEQSITEIEEAHEAAEAAATPVSPQVKAHVAATIPLAAVGAAGGSGAGDLGIGSRRRPR